jgi:UDP-N-acetylglucosamine--N-acetylmuramyl-(pentapeptide) pyrophosphoryl-undecaprenol N-acetylglucosamine transferase
VATEGGTGDKMDEVRESVLIVAGGTGGHIYPALAVADHLHARGVAPFWLGSRAGLEARIVAPTGYPLFRMTVSGLRKRGLAHWLFAPVQLSVALLQAVVVVMRTRPRIVLAMGGFVSGPGGVAAWLCRRPLIIHEQNARPGLTNRLLSHLAVRVLQAFPDSFPRARNAVTTGNPVRASITALGDPKQRLAARAGFRLLVFGGSRGARTLNACVPEAAAALEISGLEVWHQTGPDGVGSTRARYEAGGIKARVVPYIDDMAGAYAWADLVICRAGAITVAEIAAAGVGAILVPYPYAVDDHQTANAEFLSRAGAAVLLPEGEHTARRMRAVLEELGHDRSRIEHMAECARRVAVPDATARVAGQCLEFLHV